MGHRETRRGAYTTDKLVEKWGGVVLEESLKNSRYGISGKVF